MNQKRLISFDDTAGIRVCLALKAITGIAFDPSSECYKITTHMGPSYYTKDAAPIAAWAGEPTAQGTAS